MSVQNNFNISLFLPQPFQENGGSSVLNQLENFLGYLERLKEALFSPGSVFDQSLRLMQCLHPQAAAVFAHFYTRAVTNGTVDPQTQAAMVTTLDQFRAAVLNAEKDIKDRIEDLEEITEEVEETKRDYLIEKRNVLTEKRKVLTEKVNQLKAQKKTGLLQTS
jgi:hypothetical protein